MTVQFASQVERGGSSAFDIISRTHLFAGLPERQRRRLASLAQTVEVAAGQEIVAEGTQQQAVFVIARGTVEIVRWVEGTRDRHSIRRLGPCETFGELGLIDDQPTSACVCAVTSATLLVMPTADLRGAMSEDPQFDRLFRSLAEQLSSRLRSLTDVTVRALEREVAELRARVTIGSLFIGTVAVLSVFAYSLSVSTQLTGEGWHQPIVLVVCVVGLAVMAGMIRASKLPPSFWGFTTRNWRSAVRESASYSLGFVAILLMGKWVLIHTIPGWQQVPLFYLKAKVDSGGPAALVTDLLQLAVYLLIAVPLQEIVIRGCVQGALQEFLSGRYRALWAIMTSNLIFSVTHAYLSPRFALMTLVPGVMWGWLYYRQRTLIAPILSHAIVGAAAMDVIGILDLFR